MDERTIIQPIWSNSAQAAAVSQRAAIFFTQKLEIVSVSDLREMESHALRTYFQRLIILDFLFPLFSSFFSRRHAPSEEKNNPI